MKVFKEVVDSIVFGRTVLSLDEVAPDDDFAAAERQFIAEHDPVVVFAKVPVEGLASIQFLEDNGFRFVEFQIRSTLQFKSEYRTSSFPYEFRRVTSAAELEPILAIAENTFAHDRYTLDPAMGAKLSGARYRRLVEQSQSRDNEAVYGLFSQASHEPIAFKTHRYVNERDVLFLLGGVRHDLKGVGLGAVSNYFEFNELRRLGYKQGTTNISAGNYAVFNMEIGKMGFKVVQTFATLRRVYHPAYLQRLLTENSLGA